MKNIVLIGMPGCGKTTIGQIIATISGKQFIDCDNFLVENAGMPIAEIFEREGEEGFRKRETQILKDICGQSGLIIATGGGCVTREENYQYLKQNGIVIFIQRDISMLDKKDRPLSTGDIEEMYRQRFPLYRHFADCTVLNDQTAEITAQYVLKTFKLF
jgi:shikimate dehydrogenase